VRIRVLHTPGHRPEHCAFVVDERIALTGDSLFVGDAARPDLAIDARDGAEDLFHSLERLSALPEDVEVFPGHVAGSLCGGKMSAERSSTIGAERATNAALEFRNLQEFVLVSASVSTPRPPTTDLAPQGTANSPDSGSALSYARSSRSFSDESHPMGQRSGPGKRSA